MSIDINMATLRSYMEANRRVQASQSNPRQLIPVQIINTFIGVVLWAHDQHGQPRPLEEIAKKLDITPTTMSTHMRYLGEQYRDEKDGLGLVSTDIYPLNRRMKTARLTHKGRALAEQLSYILQGATTNDSQLR